MSIALVAQSSLRGLAAMVVTGLWPCLLCLSGCGTTISESYYLAVVDTRTKALQFYRFDLKASAGWNDVRFNSGWYSAEALEALVAEHVSREIVPYDFRVVPDDKSRGTPSSEEPEERPPPPDTEDARNGTRHRYFIAGPEGRFRPQDDVRLAIIIASDPQPVANAIQAFASSAQMTLFAEHMVAKAHSRPAVDRKLLDRIIESLGSAKQPDNKAE